VHISVTFLLITFFCVHFLKLFSTDSKSAWNSAFFDTQIEFSRKFYLLFLHFFKTLIANAQETTQKNGKSFFMNVSWNLTMQPSKGLHNQVVKIVVPYCGVLQGINMFKLKITLDRHNARLKLNCLLLSDPPHFSLPSTFNSHICLLCQFCQPKFWHKLFYWVGC
jgi:hypothetical protein